MEKASICNNLELRLLPENSACSINIKGTIFSVFEVESANDYFGGIRGENSGIPLSHRSPNKQGQSLFKQRML
jgi:hypothetical protein